MQKKLKKDKNNRFQGVFVLRDNIASDLGLD